MTRQVYQRVIAEARASDWAYTDQPLQDGDEEEPVRPLSPSTG